MQEMRECLSRLPNMSNAHYSMLPETQSHLQSHTQTFNQTQYSMKNFQNNTQLQCTANSYSQANPYDNTPNTVRTPIPLISQSFYYQSNFDERNVQSYSVSNVIKDQWNIQTIGKCKTKYLKNII